MGNSLQWTIELSRDEAEILRRPIEGGGGYQTFLRGIVAGLDGWRITVTHDQLDQAHRQASIYGSVGWQDRLTALLSAATRAGWRPATATRAPGRTLGEEQAYQDGKRAGWREALLAVAGGLQKVLTPDSVETLSRALLDGLARDQGKTAALLLRVADGPDATEPVCKGDQHVWPAVKFGGPILNGDLCECHARMWCDDGVRSGSVAVSR